MTLHRAACLPPAPCVARFPHFGGPAPAAKYTYIDAFNGKTVTRETLLRYTFKSGPVNVLIRGNLWKTWPSGFDLLSRWKDRCTRHPLAALGTRACFRRPETSPSEFRSDGGLGVARLTRFDTHRGFCPRTRNRVSAIGVGRFYTDRSLAMGLGKLLWIWSPAAMLAVSDCFF